MTLEPWKGKTGSRGSQAQGKRSAKQQTVCVAASQRLRRKECWPAASSEGYHHRAPWRASVRIDEENGERG